jgi:hypothetical protein
VITKNLSKKEKLHYFSELYTDAKNAYSEKLDAFLQNINQYRGSLELDGSNERAVTTRNISYEIIESQISCDIPQPKVDAACYSELRQRNASSIERLLSSLRDSLPFEELNDCDERYTYIYGASVWYVEWNSKKRVGRERGGVDVYCLNPESFIPQPGVSNVRDMDYCFLKLTSSRFALLRDYNVTRAALSLADCDYSDEERVSDSDAVSVIIAFYKDEDGDISKFTFSGELVLEDIPKLYRRKLPFCKCCSLPENECVCKEPISETVDLYTETLTQNGNEVEIPYYTPKSFPIVIRKNPSPYDSVVGQSDCEFIRPEQQAINKLESRILQKLLRAQITPIVPEDTTISLNNSIFGQVIKMKPGESAAQYGKVDTTPDISQDIIEAERLYDHAKRILGISDALQGLDTKTSESGYARQLKISQATGRLESKRKLKYTAYAELDRLIFEQYLAFADEPRALVYKDAYGRIHDAEFNRYDFIEYDPIDEEYYFNDGYLFSVDLNGGAEYQREALWQRNLENLKAGTLGDPQSNVTLLRYWQSQERAHYPHARENVEYFKLAIDKGEEYDRETNSYHGL